MISFMRLSGIVVSAFLGLAAITFPATAGDEHQGIVVEEAWARASAGAAKSGAAYLTIANHGDEVDRLISVASDAATRVEIHTHVMSENVMRMMEVEGGVEIEPGSPTVFKPGGLHVMFMGLKEPFVEGETFPITLTLENAGEMTVDVSVEGIAAMEPSHEDHHHGHGHNHGS